MATKKYSDDGVLEKLREIDFLISLGLSVGFALQSSGVSQSSYYRWRTEYGGLARTLKSLGKRRDPRRRRHQENLTN